MKTYINGHCIEQILTNVMYLTQSEYDNLSQYDKTHGSYIITDAPDAIINASDIIYDNTTSGLTADNVQEAIDEVNTNKVDKEEGKGLFSGDYDDLLNTPAVNKVYQEDSVGNAPYRILLSQSYQDTNIEATTKKSTKFNFNPATAQLNLYNNAGTVDADSVATIAVGNNIAAGNVGSSYGRLFLYSNGSSAVDLRAATNSSGNRVIYLPDKAGTLALVPELITLFSPSSSTPYLTSGQTVQVSSSAQTILNSGKYIAKITFNYQTDNNSASKFHSLCTVGSHGICARVRENPSGTLFSYRFNYSSSGVNVTTYGNDVTIYIFEIVLYNFNN